MTREELYNKFRKKAEKMFKNFNKRPKSEQEDLMKALLWDEANLEAIKVPNENEGKVEEGKIWDVTIQPLKK